jgi:hypothetical protein
MKGEFLPNNFFMVTKRWKFNRQNLLLKTTLLPA